MSSKLPVAEHNAQNLPDENALRVCKNCSNEFQGKFCNRCGEKVMNPHDRSILHFLESVFHTLTHADGKIFRNLKLILFNPGFLSKNLADGKRQPFMNPISMFFVANLIYFLFPPFPTFNMSYSSQIYTQSYSRSAREIVMQKMARENIAEVTLAEKYNAKSTTYSKLLLVLFIPMVALIFSVLNFKRSRYFADHILMALEFMCFLIFYSTLVIGYLLLVVQLIFQLSDVSLDLFTNELILIMPLVLISMLYFLFRSQRTFYGQRIHWAILKSILVIAAFAFLLDAYRFILFHITINTI